MTVKGIVQKYLKENGYDGLCNYEPMCGCVINDLMPCGEDCSSCTPGHKEKPTSENFEDYCIEDNPEWVIVAGKKTTAGLS